MDVDIGQMENRPSSCLGIDSGVGDFRWELDPARYMFTKLSARGEKSINSINDV